jgi:hypothetical protein
MVTDQELRDLVAQVAVKQAELAAQQKETDRQQRETGRQLRELGKQLGGLGEKFGSFTEGMAFPSMTKILMQRFGMMVVAPRVRARRNGRSLELDVLAYSNSDRNEAYVVEVKSHLREEGLDQLRKTLRDFREFFPEHAGKKVYGILAAVDMTDDVAEKAIRDGIYLARIHDGQFDLQVPDSFQPCAY